jgi:mono/diheme cytochrome c family protein
VRRTLAAGALVVLALAAAGCGAPSDEARAADPKQDCAESNRTSSREASALLLVGARIFDERCSPCHGDSGHGDGLLAELLPIRPRNYHADPFQWGSSWHEIEETVRVGRSGVMPPFEGALSDREIRSVAFLVACWVEHRSN